MSGNLRTKIRLFMLTESFLLYFGTLFVIHSILNELIKVLLSHKGIFVYQLDSKICKKMYEIYEEK